MARRMAPCSSGTLKSIGSGSSRDARLEKTHQRLAHAWGQLAWPQPVQPVADKNAILAPAYKQRLGCVVCRFDADDLMTQAQAGAADTRDPGAHFENIVHTRWGEVFGLRGDHRETDQVATWWDHRFARNTHLPRQHV